MLTCKRVLQCESTCVAGEARTRAACVTSVLCTRVVVYRAQRGERGIGGDEDEAVAKPGAHIRMSGNREIGKSGNREIGKSGTHRGHTETSAVGNREIGNAIALLPPPPRPASFAEEQQRALQSGLQSGRQGLRCDCNANEGNTPEDQTT